MTLEKTKSIKIERNISESRLKDLDVFSWPIWKKEVSKFSWTYEDVEICYFLEGDVIVTPENGEPVSMGKGDLVTFPAGMSCIWDVREAVKKHYCFE